MSTKKTDIEELNMREFNLLLTQRMRERGIPTDIRDIPLNLSGAQSRKRRLLAFSKICGLDLTKTTPEEIEDIARGVGYRRTI